MIKIMLNNEYMIVNANGADFSPEEGWVMESSYISDSGEEILFFRKC